MLRGSDNAELLDGNQHFDEFVAVESDEIIEPAYDDASLVQRLSSATTKYISTLMNNTFSNSADIRIADSPTTTGESYAKQQPDDLNNTSSVFPAHLSYHRFATADTNTDIFEPNRSTADTHSFNDNIRTVIRSTLNYGYSTLYNLVNSREVDIMSSPSSSASSSSSSSSLDMENEFNQSDSASASIGGATATATTIATDLINLNRSYYRHLPPSLLSEHQISVGIDRYDSQLSNINAIGTYINSTIARNLSDFLQNNNATTTSSDEQYLIKLNADNQDASSSSSAYDDSDEQYAPGAKRDFVFDRTDVKIIFITLYSLVFCCCFFGNLLVILVVTLSRRLRSITNFFLANLAVADFCVGVFCVMQNLTIYLIDSWVFGKFLCKMYQFVHSLSYTASIFILVVICMERYFAIIHPITCKQILTPSRLRMVILGVWITSAVYSTPKFIFSKTITNIHTVNGAEENICVLDRQMFNSELLDLINFGFLYVTPLLVMTILYSRIAIALWKSSRGLERHIALQNTSICSPSYSGAHLYRKPSSMKYDKQLRCGITGAAGNGAGVVGGGLIAVGGINGAGGVAPGATAIAVTESRVSMEADKVVVTTWKKANSFHQRHGTQVAQMSNSTNNVLRARRGVIRMLIIVVLTFALCNLPYHARKMWMYWSVEYKGYSNFNALFTPLTFLATYFNSGVNPLLYAFLSRNFRKGMRELLLCSFRKSKNKSSSMHQRVPLQEVASAVMQAVNLPLDKLKGRSMPNATAKVSATTKSNSNHISNRKENRSSNNNDDDDYDDDDESIQHLHDPNDNDEDDDDSHEMREQQTEIISTEGL